MIPIDLNYWSILAAGVSYFVLGALWYAAPVFGKSWMKAIGKTKEQVEADFSAMNLVWAFIGSLIIACGLARVIAWSGCAGLVGGIQVGVLVAVCFVGANTMIHDKMEGRPRILSAINFLYAFVGFAIMGAILGTW